MPKPSPVADALSKPFWDACNEGRLVMQNCTACTWLQFPPEPTCSQCGSNDHLEWKQMSGRGTIHGYAVMHDTRIRTFQKEQPYTIALIELEEDPAILLYSNLPGTPPDDVPVGAAVQVI